MTVNSSVCDWCGEPFDGKGKYCRRSHRQRAYEARIRAGANLVGRDDDPTSMIRIITQARVEQRPASEGLAAAGALGRWLDQQILLLSPRTLTSFSPDTDWLEVAEALRMTPEQAKTWWATRLQHETDTNP